MLQVETSKVKAKDAKMPKSFSAVTPQQIEYPIYLLGKDQHVQLPGAVCLLCLALQYFLLCSLGVLSNGRPERGQHTGINWLNEFFSPAGTDAMFESLSMCMKLSTKEFTLTASIHCVQKKTSTIVFVHNAKKK